jgi:hypothetical protein
MEVAVVLTNTTVAIPKIVRMITSATIVSRMVLDFNDVFILPIG